MQRFVGSTVVCFLKKNVCSDSRILKHFVFFVCSCRYVYIHASYRTIFVLYGINCIYAFKNIFNRIVYRIFTCFECKPLVSQILQCNCFTVYFFLCQFLAAYVFVVNMIRAVSARVNAIIRKIKRRKKNNSVSVKTQLDFFCQCLYFVIQLGNIAVQKNSSLAVTYTLTERGFFKNRFYQRRVTFVFCRIIQRIKNFFIIYKIFCTCRLNIIHFYLTLLYLSGGI